MLVPSVGALEGHVLQEVGRSVGFIGLCPGHCIYPDADSGCLRVGM